MDAVTVAEAPLRPSVAVTDGRRPSAAVPSRGYGEVGGEGERSTSIPKARAPSISTVVATVEPRCPVLTDQTSPVRFPPGAAAVVRRTSTSWALPSPGTMVTPVTSRWGGGPTGPGPEEAPAPAERAGRPSPVPPPPAGASSPS